MLADEKILFIISARRKCFPIICNELLIGVGNAVISIVLGRQSEQAIAAIAVFRTLEGMVIGFFAGFSNAASVLVGTCVGAGELRTAERAKRIVCLCCYIDEPIRFVIMQKHMYSGKWIRPVTPQGKAALPPFMAELSAGRKCR